MTTGIVSTAESLGGLIDATALSLVVAFRDASEQGLAYELRRVEMDNDLRDFIRDVLKKALRRYRVDEPLRQDPDRPLRRGEWYTAEPEVLGLSALAAQLNHPSSLEVLELSELGKRNPAWYAFVASSGDGTFAAFIRRSRRLILARHRGVVAFFRENILVRAPSATALQFDEQFDLVLQQGRVLVANTNILDDAFTDRQRLVALIPQHLQQLSAAGLELVNVEEFAQACESNLYMMRKLARIVESGYIKNITVSKVTRIMKEFGVNGRVVETGKFVFDKDNRWLLLKVLDDDYLRSPMTAGKYESSAKIRVL